MQTAIELHLLLSSCPATTMAPSDEIQQEFLPFLRIYKDGHVERLMGAADATPAGTDPATGVRSADAIVQPETGVSARLYLPVLTDTRQKLPVLVHFHGGAFSIGSTSSPVTHSYLNTVAAQAHALIMSVDYRLAPEHPIPAAYDDSWAALQWVASHAGSDGPHPWVADHGDLRRLFLSGESAGANIAHQMAMRTATDPLAHGVEITGSIMTHPYFWGTTPLESETADAVRRARIAAMWKLVYQSTSGCDLDPYINPVGAGAAPGLSGLACKRVLVCVAREDVFRARGLQYYGELGRSGYGGEAELLEQGGQHVFHLFDQECDRSVAMMKKVVEFINRQ